MARKQINKSAENDDEVFELTNIRVKEVSLVDRAANKRKFLVMKKDKKSTADAITSDEVGKALERAQETLAGTPAAELDRLDAVAAAASKAGDAVVPAADAVEPVVAPAVAPIAKETLVVDGGTVIDIQVTSTPSFAEGSAEQVLAQKIRAAWVGAIDAIRARLDAMAEAVNRPTEGIYVHWDAYSHIDAIRCMLECFYDIGCPEWEIEVAAVAAAAAKGESVGKKQDEVKKVGRAISSARMRSLKDMHGLVSDLQKRFDALLSEVESEPETEKTATTAVKAEEPAVVAAVVAPPAATVVETPVAVAAPVATPIDISQDPAFKALADSMKKQQDEIERLRNIAASQEQQLQKARSHVRSNALTPEPVTNHNDHVTWPRDMASPDSRISHRTRR